MKFIKNIISGKLNFTRFKQQYLDSSSPRPPYAHIVQIGDPILRCKARKVNPEEIGTRALNQVLINLHHVFRNYGSNILGLAAPQIGIDLRIFLMEVKAKNIADYTNNVQKQIKEVPFQVWINPEMKILDYKTVTHSEECASFHGFSADVPRYKKVLLTGLNERGETKQLEASDFTARIIQHEMDHLDGIIYTDKMHVRSLECCGWSQINETRGKVFITFAPTNWWFNLMHPRVK